MTMVTETGQCYKRLILLETPTEIDADTPVLNDLYGTTVEQGLIGQGLAIGAPGYASGKGAVYCYGKSDTNTYQEVTIMTPTATGFVGAGTSLSVGNTEWVCNPALLQVTGIKVMQ